jgi:hypothetical protein
MDDQVILGHAKILNKLLDFELAEAARLYDGKTKYQSKTASYTPTPRQCVDAFAPQDKAERIWALST